MEFRFTADEDAFRTRVRDFLGGWVGPNGQVASERFDDLEREMAAQN